MGSGITGLGSGFTSHCAKTRKFHNILASNTYSWHRRIIEYSKREPHLTYSLVFGHAAQVISTVRECSVQVVYVTEFLEVLKIFHFNIEKQAESLLGDDSFILISFLFTSYIVRCSYIITDHAEEFSGSPVQQVLDDLFGTRESISGFLEDISSLSFRCFL